jgi:hypothetical protein
MALVFIKCPTTGSDVSTSQHMREAEFDVAEFPNAAFRCSACGEIHRWRKAEAWIDIRRPKIA